MIDYLKYYSAPVALAIGFAGFWLGGDAVWLGIATFPALAILDSLVPRDMSLRRMRSEFWASLPVWISAMGPVFLYLAFAWCISTHQLTLLQMLGGALTCGWFSVMPGIAAQHELYHSRGKCARTFGRYGQITMLDCMRDIEHVVGHHIDVGTPLDASTGTRGMNLYQFTWRSLKETTRFGIRMECEAMEKRGLSRWNIRHRIWRTIGIQVLFQTLVFAIGGWIGVTAVLGGMLIARVWVESFNYFQHYGHVRVPGTPIGRRHVWNHMGFFTRVMGFEITNHADHHLNSYQPFYALVPHREAIPMPSVFVCFMAALVPPLWHELIIKPALKRWDLEFATPAERDLARRQNLDAGWEDWFAADSSRQAGRVPATSGC